MIARTMIAEDLESGNVIEVGVENDYGNRVAR